MRVLVLDEWLPSMCNSGKSIRTFELLAPLARRHEITYLAHLDGEQEAENVRKMRDAGFDVVCVPRPAVYGSVPAILLGTLPALLDSNPISVRRHFSSQYVREVRRLATQRRFDLVHIEWTHYALYGSFIPDLPQFVCTHNVEYLSWFRFARTAVNPVKKLLGWHEGWKMKRFERRCYRRVDGLSVVSREDAELVRELCGRDDSVIIPNGVSIAPYDEVPNRPRQDHLVYCGSMDAFVNQDAVDWFLREVFPRIRDHRPGVSLTVIGRDPPNWLRRRENDQIRFTGRIDDVRHSLKEAVLEVVPLRVAGGSRLKILEAFAARLPVVSTTIGAEGLEVRNGEHLLLADSAEDFARSCLELLDDEDRRRSLAEKGRTLVDRFYDWSRIYPLVEAAWERSIDLADRGGRLESTDEKERNR